MKSILDKSFQYRNSSETDLAKTFARVRRQMAEDAKREAAAQAEVAVKVKPITKARQ